MLNAENVNAKNKMDSSFCVKLLTRCMQRVVGEHTGTDPGADKN